MVKDRLVTMRPRLDIQIQPHAIAGDAKHHKNRDRACEREQTTKKVGFDPLLVIYYSKKHEDKLIF
jgi:hypothetical protein